MLPRKLTERDIESLEEEIQMVQQIERLRVWMNEKRPNEDFNYTDLREIVCAATIARAASRTRGV